MKFHLDGWFFYEYPEKQLCIKHQKYIFALLSSSSWIYASNRKWWTRYKRDITKLPCPGGKLGMWSSHGVSMVSNFPLVPNLSLTITRINLGWKFTPLPVLVTTLGIIYHLHTCTFRFSRIPQIFFQDHPRISQPSQLFFLEYPSLQDKTYKNALFLFSIFHIPSNCIYWLERAGFQKI